MSFMLPGLEYQSIHDVYVFGSLILDGPSQYVTLSRNLWQTWAAFSTPNVIITVKTRGYRDCSKIILNYYRKVLLFESGRQPTPGGPIASFKPLGGDRGRAEKRQCPPRYIHRAPPTDEDQPRRPPLLQTDLPLPLKLRPSAKLFPAARPERIPSLFTSLRLFFSGSDQRRAHPRRGGGRISD